jgi:hypothetical protein
MALQQIPAPDFFQFFVTAPATERNFVLLLCDADETSIDQELFGTLADFECLAQLLTDPDEGAGPLGENVVWWACPVIGFELYVHFDLVDPAAGLEMARERIVRRGSKNLHGTAWDHLLISLLVKLWPVAYAPVH